MKKTLILIICKMQISDLIISRPLEYRIHIHVVICYFYFICMFNTQVQSISDTFRLLLMYYSCKCFSEWYLNSSFIILLKYGCWWVLYTTLHIWWLHNMRPCWKLLGSLFIISCRYLEPIKLHGVIPAEFLWFVCVQAIFLTWRTTLKNKNMRNPLSSILRLWKSDRSRRLV